MKMPSMAAGTGGGGSLGQTLLAQIDKLLAAAAVLLGGFILWGGLDTIRTRSVSRERSPGVISESVEQARRHMQSGAAPPDDLIPPRRPLEEVVAEWILPELPPQDSAIVFNRPLFGELAARSKPDILPVEKLTARAGLAVLAARPAVRQAEKEEPSGKDDDKRRPKKPNPGQTAPEGSPSMGPAAMDPFGMTMTGGAPVEIPGKVVPYVIVTGLIPYRKQFKEFTERFQFASFTNPLLDQPSWGPFSIERAEVDDDGQTGEWKRIDPRDIQARARREWVNVQKESLPPTFLLPVAGPNGPQAATEPSFATYCLPLPLLAQDRWGLDALHPWFVEPLAEIGKRLAASAGSGMPFGMNQPPGLEGGPVSIGAGGPMGSGGPMEAGGFGPGGFGPGGFGPGGFGPGSSPAMTEPMAASPGAYPGADMSSGSLPPAAGGFPGMDGGMSGATTAMRGEDGEEYRLFRFLDTDVQPDTAYVYRVRVAVRNPNLGVPARYLKDAALSTGPWLVSEHSQPSEKTQVPESVSILARTLLKDGSPDSLKELKIREGMAELLVLAENTKSGRLTLRSIVAEPGGVLDVEESLNKSGGLISTGETVKTGAVLLDVRGTQIDRGDERDRTRGRGKSVPPEPLEALLLEPVGEDGFRFGVVSLTDSEHAVDVFRGTLPKEVSSIPPAAAMGGPGQPYSP